MNSDPSAVCCLCGNPKPQTRRHPEYSSEGRSIMLRLDEIQRRRKELAREMGRLSAEEDRLRAEFASLCHLHSDFTVG